MENIIVKDKTFEISITENQILDKVKELQEKIHQDYKGKTPLFIGVLNGSFIFMSDLVKGYPGDCEMDFLKVSSYDGMESTGNVQDLMGLKNDVKDRDLILVEDIVDTGLTIKKIVEKLEKLSPSSISIVSLLFKPDKCHEDLSIDYLGFSIPNEFVIGYGLDFDGLVRNLKHIYRLKE
jgi:hypoxanthine phosphoribosyltransferase